MAVVDDCSVAAILAVLMGVVLVNCVLSRHQLFPLKIASKRLSCWSSGYDRSEACARPLNEVQNMLIGQVIQNVFPIAPSSDDVVGT
jgi:hypothetical protein